MNSYELLESTRMNLDQLCNRIQNEVEQCRSKEEYVLLTSLRNELSKIRRSTYNVSTQWTEYVNLINER